MAVVVGAALGLEGRLNGCHARAQPAQHVLDHAVAADAQAVADDLQLGVAIAEMPGEARQCGDVGGGNLGKRLGPSDHRDNRAVAEHEAVAVA